MLMQCEQRDNLVDPVVGLIIYDLGKVGLDQAQNEPKRREYDYFPHELNSYMISGSLIR